jgi:hypothetical protein
MCGDEHKTLLPVECQNYTTDKRFLKKMLEFTPHTKVQKKFLKIYKLELSMLENFKIKRLASFTFEYVTLTLLK